MRRAALALTLVLLGCGPATTHPVAAPRTPAAVATGPKIDSEEQYTAERGEYEALAVDAAERPGRRATLEGYLLGQLGQTLDGGHLEEAYELLKQALTLYDAAELRGRTPPSDPALLAAAERTEKAFRRRGAHQEVMVALAVETSLASDEKPARGRFDEVTAWLRTGGTNASQDDGSGATDGRELVVEDLEAAARLWPSRFVVEQLTALYFERQGADGVGGFNRRLRRGADLRELIQGGPKVGLAYELSRLYLRISRPDEAAQNLKKVVGQPGDDAALRGLVDKYASATAQPGDAIQLAQQFAQPGHDDRDVALRICKDAARRFPSSPDPRLWAGKFAYSLEQLVVALKNFEAAVKLDPEREENWEALAKLYQARLFQVVSDENLNVAELEAQLRRVESFHAEAQKKFPGKPLKPSMADALFEVGRGYYNAGRLADATRYLERTISLSATPQSLELLGQVRLKKGEGQKAVKLFQDAQDLPKADKGDQLWWRAKLRRQIADATEATGDKTAADAERRAALADWDVLVGYGLTPEALAESGLEKAKLLYQLGDRDASLESFEKAIDAAPDRGSTYADVIAFLVPRAELEEALDAYHRALGRNEVTDYLKVYCSLWIVDLARRAGQPEDPLATAYLKSTDGGKWYDDLARWATGRENDAQLLAHADTPARKAECAFYRAMRAVNDAKPAEALTLWHQVLDTDMMAFFEYDMAAFYLKVGSAPAHPLLKSKPREDRSSPQPPSRRRPPDGSI